MKKETKLILASASARRQRLLAEAGVRFDVVIPLVDESDCPAIAKDTVVKNAVLKNRWAAERLPGTAIISADTAIDFEGDLIGKPGDIAAAREQLLRFAGHTHKVLTGISCSYPEEEPYNDVFVSPVTFRELDDAVIDQYFALVDPMDKAGSYDIGSHGDLIVESYSGSLSNIIGLPMELITPWLKEHGFIQ